MSIRGWVVVGLAAMVVGGAGCEACDDDDPFVPPGDGDADSDADGDADGGIPPGLGVGDPCQADSECRPGLECDDSASTCQPVPDGAAGEPCTLSGECSVGLYCGLAGVCEPAGAAAEGEACGSPADCAPGLYCDVRGLSGGSCMAAGTGDWNDACETTSDCLPGLFCGVGDLCAPFLLAFPPWQGGECPPDEEASVAYFEVPRGGTPANDFFRLPFPNDIRVVDGHVDLTTLPTPGPGLVGVDLVALYKGAIERDLTAFGTNSPVYFRFSQGLDHETLEGAGDTPTIDIENITPASSGYATFGGWHWSYNHSSRYVCPQWLALGPTIGISFAPETTYAAWLTTGVLGADGTAITRDEDFVAMMSDETPADADLAAAHAKYQILREYFDAQVIPRDTILVASVFTTGAVRSPASRLREAVHASGDPPAPLDLMLCQEGAASICAPGGDPADRDCEGEDDAYFELHGRFDNPMMQAGARPYELTGGNIEVDGGGLPIVQGTEQVCFSLTIPKGVTMPLGGWPIVITSHGTGGNFRSALRQEVAGSLSSVQTGTGETVNFAVFGYDGAMHGDRRGGSPRGEDELFFNALNPPAARDNMLQGASDLFQIVRLVRAFDVDPTASPTGEAIRFDTSRIYFFGHSQGSSVGALFAPYEEDVDVAVFSGAGAHLVSSLIHKTSPVDVTLGMALILQEQWDDLLQIGVDHPILNLFQAYFEPSDAINYGRLLVREPVDGGTHFLMTYGTGDTYSPVETLAAFARAGYAASLTPELEDTRSSSADVAPPVSANVRIQGIGDFTAVCTQHAPTEGNDGHFVVYDDETANRRMLQFFGTAAVSGTGTPTAVE
jgi:hypothetical protein